MSWQDYVDNQLLASQCVSKAAIAGHDGGVWAKSEGFDVSWATYKLQHREYSILWMALIFFPLIPRHCRLSAIIRRKRKKKRKYPCTTKQTDEVKLIMIPCLDFFVIFSR